MIRPALLAAFALLLAGCGGKAPRAPDFTAPDLDGQLFRLADLRGEVVVLNFWATWCPPCVVEMPEFVRLAAELRGQGVRFVGVSQDRGGAADVRPFAERLGVNYPLVLDPSAEVLALYGAEYLPTTFVIDREGRVHASKVGALDRRQLLDLLGDLIDRQTLRLGAEPEMAHRPGLRRGDTSRQGD